MICQALCPHCCGEDVLTCLTKPPRNERWRLTALHALSLVDRRVGGEARRILYHVYYSRATALPAFVNTLIHDPDLASLVHAIQFNGDISAKDNIAEYYEVLFPHLGEAIPSNWIEEIEYDPTLQDGVSW